MLTNARSSTEQRRETRGKVRWTDSTSPNGAAPSSPGSRGTSHPGSPAAKMPTTPTELRQNPGRALSEPQPKRPTHFNPTHIFHPIRYRVCVEAPAIRPGNSWRGIMGSLMRLHLRFARHLARLVGVHPGNLMFPVGFGLLRRRAQSQRPFVVKGPEVCNMGSVM